MPYATTEGQTAKIDAHNVLDPALPASLTVTRAPTWLVWVYPQRRTALRLLTKVAAGAPVPFDAYLEMRRVSPDPTVAEFFYTDLARAAVLPDQLARGDGRH